LEFFKNSRWKEGTSKTSYLPVWRGILEEDDYVQGKKDLLRSREKDLTNRVEATK